MYNVLTVSNKSYQEFLIYFINSLLKNCELNNINKIYILDNGIDNHVINELSNKNKKIIFLKNENRSHNITYSGWSNDWGYNVDTKTLFLKNILEKDKIPSFLIDVDCFFMKNFTDVIDFEKDVIVCDRGYSDNPIIASFIYLNYNEKSLNFLNRWIEEQSLMTSYPKETKCLNKTIKLLNKECNIGVLDFKIINFYYEPKDQDELNKIYIIHLKGAVKKDTFEEEIKNRLNRLDCFVDKTLYT